MIGLPGLRNRKVVAQRSAGELDAMAAAGALVAAALQAVRQAAAPGVSTLELDEIAESVIRDGGGIPSFLGYHGFPASICSSVNDRVVHGIPSATEVLAAGRPGVHRLRRDPRRLARRLGDHVRRRRADPRRRGAVARPPGSRWRPASPRWCPATGSPTSRTPSRPAPTPPRRATTASSASSRATAGTASAGRCTWTRSCPTRAHPAAGRYLAPGSVLAIEPMLTLGTTKTVVLDDEWTVVTADGSRAAHWEHTVAVTDDGPRILTMRTDLQRTAAAESRQIGEPDRPPSLV